MAVRLSLNTGSANGPMYRTGTATSFGVTRSMRKIPAMRDPSRAYTQADSRDCHHGRTTQPQHRERQRPHVQNGNRHLIRRHEIDEKNSGNEGSEQGIYPSRLTRLPSWPYDSASTPGAPTAPCTEREPPPHSASRDR